MTKNLNKFQSSNAITQLFLQAKEGDDSAINKLIEYFYHELKSIASSRKKPFKKNSNLNTTALVNEVWLKLEKSKIEYNDKGHFLSVAANAMRQILLDDVKKKIRDKRPDFVSVMSNVDNINSYKQEFEMFYQLDKILNKLEKHSSRLATVFSLKFFCGFTLDEIAKQLEVSKKTAQRDWEKSKQIINTAYALTQ